MPVPQVITAVVVGVGVAFGLFMYFLVNQNTPTLQEPLNNHCREYIDPPVHRSRPPKPSTSDAQPSTSNSKVVRRRKNSQEKEERCIICFGSMAGNEHCELICKHKYHVECISKWKELKDECPICRRRIE